MSARREHHVGIAALAALCFLVLIALTPARASALTQSPQWAITSVSQPANFAPGDSSDSYMLTATNTGGAPTDGSQVSIADTLPPQLTATEISALDVSSSASFSCDLPSLTCTTTEPIQIGDQVDVWITFAVPANASGTLSNSATVSGGGAAATTTAPEPTPVSTAPGSFGLAPGSFFATPSTTQAGAHADLTTQFILNTDASGSTDGYLRNTVVDLPPGFSGDPYAVPTCTEAQLVGTGHEFAACPADSQLGTIAFTLNPREAKRGVSVSVPLYNMELPPGAVNVLGFNFSGVVSQTLEVTVRPGDSGLEVTSTNLAGGAGDINDVSVTTWGVPADHVHDPMRGRICVFGGCSGGGNSANIEPLPFFSNSTRCAAALTATINANSWEDSAQQTEEASIAPFSGCERLGFVPQLVAQLTTNAAESPTGFNVSMIFPQTYEDPVALATAHLKKAVVILPEGITLNPSAGSGLGVCTPAQYEAETAHSLPGEGCPNESMLGAVEVETPVLKERATGFIYLAKPFDNPFDSLLSLYLVVRIPQRGVIVKTAGHIEPNPVTGQLVTTFDNGPQVPFNKLELKFRQGATSPLASPPLCGAYTALADLSSWSEPEKVNLQSSSFEVEHGIGGGLCPSGGVPPFAPKVISGTLSNIAGAYSPFYLRIIRNDGEQEITKFSTVLPPGLSANLSGIPFCPDADIEAARHVSGAQETAEPSCPASSEIGHTFVGAGVGGVLAQTPGKVYLAGPYHGSALSIVSITSATVGPFDLGTVVIRFALRINPITAQAEVDSTGSDPIPHIIDGIITHVRDIRVYIDREKFMLNPTSCNPMSLAATITGAGANPANPADQQPVTVGERFQVTNCAALAFKPLFKASTSGKTSRANGASLTVKLSFPKAPQGSEANIAKVKVNLPKQLPSRLTTLQKACAAATFNANPASCPAASKVGTAKAITPILPVPLTGPAYFVSHGGEAFPSLIVVLQGYGITVDLVGTTFISKAGITSSTFKTVPDVPVGSFELKLPQGKYSALAANGNLCKSALKMPTAFVAQNGAVIHTSTPIGVTGCAKHKKAKSKPKKKK